MKAMLCTRFGGPDDLEYADLPDPTPGEGEVVVAIRAAALNFFDTLIIAGKYQFKPPFPFSPASEFAGVVESVGAGVSGFAPGDRVLGYGGHGAAREKIAITAQRVVKIPDTLDFDRAAGITVIYGTTLHALKDRAQLKSGETLACSARPAAPGLAAIELGKLMGARVIACASSDDKLAFCRERGADEVINYAKEDVKEGLRRVTGGKGADVIYDPVGGPYAEPALRAIAWAGRYPGDRLCGRRDPENPAQPRAAQRLRHSSACSGARSSSATRRAIRPTWRDLVRWAAEGKLSAHVHAVYPLQGHAGGAEGDRGRARSWAR